MLKSRMARVSSCCMVSRSRLGAGGESAARAESARHRQPNSSARKMEERLRRGLIVAVFLREARPLLISHPKGARLDGVL